MDVRSKNKTLYFLDFETRSKIKSGWSARSYSKHKTTEPLFLAYIAISDQELDKSINLKDVNVVNFYKKEQLPEVFCNPIKEDVLVVVHNYYFEYAIMRHILVEQYGMDESWCDPRVHRDTKIMGNLVNFPSSLKDAAEYSQLVEKKSDDGFYLIQKYSLPNRIGEYVPITKEDERKFILYNKQDILTTIELYKVLVDFIEKIENDIGARNYFYTDWLCSLNTFRINSLVGIHLDSDFVKKANEFTELLSESIIEGYEKAGLNIKSVKNLQEHIEKKYNVVISSFDRNILQPQIAGYKHESLRKLLQDRVTISSFNQIKYSKALNKIYDGYLYEELIHAQASTGRFSSRGVQIHNLKNSFKSSKDIEDFINFIKQGKNYEHIINNNDATLLTQMLQGSFSSSIIPVEGDDVLLCIDYSQIEPRLLFHLSGQKDALELLVSDNRLYTDFARKVFNIQPDKVIPKSAKEYKLAKQIILASGYGMGSKTLADRLKEYYIDLPTASKYLNIYKKTYPRVPELWYKTERAMKLTCKTGKPNLVGLVEFHMVGNACVMVIDKNNLGSVVVYLNCRYDQSNDELSYHRWSVLQKRFVNVKLWGGIIVENICQSAAATILRKAIVNLEQANYHPYFHVHDEIVFSMKEKNLEKVSDILKIMKGVYPGLVLDAEHTIQKRYYK